MEIQISNKKTAAINPGMMGLFFEDINYAADGGLYAEMIENRSFEFVEAFGDKGDYYTKFDGGYGWSIYPAGADAQMDIVSGSALYEENPHYLRLTTKQAGVGVSNKAYSGIYVKKDCSYRVSFYARSVYSATMERKGIQPCKSFRIILEKDGVIAASAKAEAVEPRLTKPVHWEKYEVILTAACDLEAGTFALVMDEPGVAEFDFVSMMPMDAVAGVFRKDLFEMLKALNPGFIRFPGGCIVEGNTLDNRYRYKDTLKVPEARRGNWNRWAVHNNKEENDFHSVYSHYNQTYGLGYYEYFVLCELLGAKPLPVMNVGMACQYQSYEWYELDDERFDAFVQDAIDLITFANGSTDTKWGAVRAALGHPEPFGLTFLGIGNEQWQTKEADFFKRYELFEAAIHKVYPEICLIGSAGPDVISEHFTDAWEFYGKHEEEKDFVYAVDEHYYMKPEWFFSHADFYDTYPRTRKVFSGEYAAHPEGGVNTLEGALAEAAFLTGVERNADVVLLSSYAPLFSRHGYTQWSPDMIWFDEKQAYGSPSYYVQKMYCNNMGTDVVALNGQEKTAREQGIYMNASFDDKTQEYIVKVVNESGQAIPLTFYVEGKKANVIRAEVLSGDPQTRNTLENPVAAETRYVSELPVLENHGFAVYRLDVE